MTRRSKIWLVIGVLFTLVNFAGGVVAAAQGESLHAATHAALTLLGAYLVWRFAPRRNSSTTWQEPEIPAAPSALSDRLTNLEQSVDAVAIEIVRIGEGQRFMTKVFTDNGPAEPPAESSAVKRDQGTGGGGA